MDIVNVLKTPLQNKTTFMEKTMTYVDTVEIFQNMTDPFFKLTEQQETNNLFEYYRA